MADVVGYSSLMERDEAGTHARVQACLLELFQPAVSRHHGRLIRQMGDGILADFDSATEAVACAVEMQRAMTSRTERGDVDSGIRWRMGINVGDVIQEGNDIFGDDVNVAARLQSLAPAGSILISAGTYNEVHRYAGCHFEYAGRKKLKNISEPVDTYLIDVSADGHRPAGVIVDAAVADESGELPRIAVLPFDDLGSKELSQLFIDGFVEDLIAELSRFRTLSVIARSSSFALRGEKLTILELGRRLGADYVVEGSIRQLGPKIRIVVQLIEAERQNHVWSDRYDADLSQVFDLQDKIISEIVGALARMLAMEGVDTIRRVRANDLRAYDLWLQGTKLMEEWSAECDAKAIPLLERAIKLDPRFARAYSSLAAVYNCRNILSPGYVGDENDRRTGFSYAKQAVLLDPVDAGNHVNLGWSCMLARDFTRARRHFDLAGKLNPHDADVLISRAIAIAYLGNAHDGLALAESARRLNPYHPDYYLGNLTIINFLAGAYGKAAEIAAQIARLWPEIAGWKAAGHALAGDAAAARAAAAEFVHDVRQAWKGAREPTDADIVRWFFAINAIQREADRARLLDGLVAAGLAAIPLAETTRAGDLELVEED